MLLQIKDQNTHIPTAAIGGGVFGGFLMIMGFIGMYCCYVRGFAFARLKHPQIYFENESGPESYINGSDVIPFISNEMINTILQSPIITSSMMTATPNNITNFGSEFPLMPPLAPPYDSSPLSLKSFCSV